MFPGCTWYEHSQTHLRIIDWIRRALGNSAITGDLDKAAELGIGHRVLIHPETIHDYPAPRPGCITFPVRICLSG